MSLINDALKRAREAQEKTPLRAAPGPPLRPAEPAPRKSGGPGLLILAIAVVTGGFLMWQISRVASSGPAEPEMAMASSAPLAEASEATRALVPATIETPRVPETSASMPAAAPPVDLRPADATAVSDAASIGATELVPVSAIEEAAAVEPAPKPVPLRLQAIVFHPTRPSAIVSGRSVFVGDPIGVFQVVAIHRESVMLAGAGQTNVLTLR
jgi:hypothetical protein